MEWDWNCVQPLENVGSRHASGFSVSLDVCRASFDADYNQVSSNRSQILGFIGTQTSSEWGDSLANLFMEWRNNVPPTMPALLGFACDYFKIKSTHRLFSTALAACVLSEIPHINSYHNNHHFREVFTVTICLCAMHNEVAGRANRLDATDILLLLTAAAIHDFGHDGRGNIMDGDHYPMRLEQRSFDYAKPFLMAAGASADDLDIIRGTILGTDVSKSAQYDSQSNCLKSIYQAHRGRAAMPEKECETLHVLKTSQKATLLAMLMAEADIAPSTGLNYDFSMYSTVLVARESSILQPSANTLYGFMKHICNGEYLTQAARTLMAENFTAISLQAEQDSEENRLYA